MKQYLHIRVVTAVLSAFSAIILAALTIVVLFEPGLSYKTVMPVPAADTAALLQVLTEAVGEAPMNPGEMTLFADGAQFYPAELDLIRSATRSIDLEAFIFHQTPIGERFIAELAARARAGIKVRVVVDAVGSFPTSDHFFDPLRAAGGQVVWYQPFRWYTLKRWNNRTHRELLIVDGAMAFIGGAGIGAAWDAGTPGLPPWRDLMVRVQGETARSLQSVFSQSWLEGSGEILIDKHDQATLKKTTAVSNNGAYSEAIVVSSNPTGGRATRARVIYQLLVDASRKELFIGSPYFVPDQSMRDALKRAVARGVNVTVLTPGKHNNHLIARIASRRHYGELIAAGVHIFEYQPGMIHTKVFLVDGLWAVVGSTNFDNRSFGLNNEANLSVRDPLFNALLKQLVDSYLLRSREISLVEWQARPLLERFVAGIGSVVERQE